MVHGEVVGLMNRELVMAGILEGITGCNAWIMKWQKCRV